MRHSIAFVLVSVVLAVLLSSKTSLAAPAPTTVGVYVTQVASIDLKANTFTIDFWIWFRSTGREVSPIDSFEIIDGRVNSKVNAIKKKLPNGEDYAAVRVNATVHQQWDLHRYPFDDHDLTVMVEETDLDVAKSVFIPDAQAQGKDPNVVVAGWEITGYSSGVDEHHYDSNYGDLSVSSAAQSTYSRFTFKLPAKQRGSARFLKVAFPLLISVLVAWCGFFIRPKDSSPRVAVSVGALFAAAAATVAINSQLPDINYATVTDRTVFLSFAMIGLSLIGTVTALTLNYKNRDSVPFDRIGAMVYPAIFVGMLVWIVT